MPEPAEPDETIESALITLKSLAKSDNDPSIRLQAAQTLLQYSTSQPATPKATQFEIDRSVPKGYVRVILFRVGGKYYTEEDWRIPRGAIGPYDMRRSPDFRRIGGGPVLIPTQEPWGYPHLFMPDDYYQEKP